jgi:hypothetical protein
MCAPHLSGCVRTVSLHSAERPGSGFEAHLQSIKQSVTFGQFYRMSEGMGFLYEQILPDLR